MTTAISPGPVGTIQAAEMVAALLTGEEGGELQLVSRDGTRLRLAADATTARQLALTLWRALDERERRTKG